MILLAVAIVYLVAPGHPQLPFQGVPLGLSGAAAVAVLVLVFAFWGSSSVDHPKIKGTLLVAVVLVGLKVLVGLMSPTAGWSGRYYANDSFRPPYRRSLQFSDTGATRIDPKLDFEGDTFPLYYLNEREFGTGKLFRERTEPLSVHWTGHLVTAEAEHRTLTLAARGEATLSIDGERVLSVDSVATPASVTERVRFTSGAHTLEVDYVKPGGTEGLVELAWEVEGQRVPLGGPDVTPVPVPGLQRGLGAGLLPVAVGLDIAAFLLIAHHLALIAMAGSWRRSRAPGMVAERTLFLLLYTSLVIQGWVVAAWSAGRTVTFDGGDDWFVFEAGAREIVIGGLLMTFGAPLGQGDAFVHYPLYSYFIGLLHVLIGEDLFGVIFVQFLLLGVTATVVHRTTKRLFGPGVALGGTIILALVFQLDFTRYYTVTLLTENLYFLTVAVTVLYGVRFLETRRVVDLARCGVAGGVSAITRPAMMLYFPWVVGLMLVATWRHTRSAQKAAVVTTLFVVCWMAMVLPITLRNYIVSGSPVFITTGQAETFLGLSEFPN